MISRSVSSSNVLLNLNMASTRSCSWQQQESNKMATGDDMHTELCKACAGSSVDFPKVGAQVYYFPQGHLEQFDASTDYESNELVFSLPSEILCRVVDVQLQADQDTDDVYAQMTLLPEANETEPTSIDLNPVEPSKATVHSFCKVLTVSDMSTRHGLYVPREHANKCLPPLDMSQEIPAQLLVAKDLHGTEWNFKHTFRGQPPRHMLTTGWNVFVTSKRLTAGDTIVFLRREDWEMRIGVKRLARPQSSFLSSGISSDSLQKKVQAVADVTHALHVRSHFVVDCNPRLSQFIIPVNKYVQALEKKFSIGMKIKMPFGVEDPWAKRFTGTIVGIGDICRRKWPNSKWRCCKIQWDAPPSFTTLENVSPWEIEPLVNFVPRSTIHIREKLISNEMPVSVLRKGKRKLHKKPEEQVEGLDAVVSTGPQPMRASVEDPGERLDDRCRITTEDIIELDYEEEIEIQNDTAANVKENAAIQGTNESRGRLTDLLSANLFQDETRAQPQVTFTNQVPLSNISGKDRLGHILNFDIPHSVSPDNTIASNGSNTWFMNLLQGIDHEELEPERETSSHLQPLPENTDHMPIDGTLSLACQSFSSNMIYISSTPSVIPYIGPGRGDEQVPWARYLLARRCIPILDRIITRYPELLSSFRVTNKALQSTSLEILAEVVYMLEHLTVGSTNSEQLDVSRRYLNDLKMTIKVDWIEKRLLQMDAVFKKHTLVRCHEELSLEVESANAKFRQLKGRLESVDKELEEVTSIIDTNPLNAGQSVMQGLL